jgi:hypothetical protein
MTAGCCWVSFDAGTLHILGAAVREFAARPQHQQRLTGARCAIDRPAADFPPPPRR